MMLEAWGREKNGGNDYIGHNSLDDNIMYLSSSDVGPNGSTATGLAMHSGWDADHSSYNNFVRRITNKWDADPAVEKLGSE